jgi:hypothetical protein
VNSRCLLCVEVAKFLHFEGQPCGIQRVQQGGCAIQRVPCFRTLSETQGILLFTILCLQWASNNLWPVNPNASQSAQSGRMAVMLILETGELRG